ncbi:MAG: Rab family GTPase [Pseudomonadota bacterium]
MIAKKVCLIGEFGVGKTSLVARYVNHTFSDKYITTVGVSIKTKVVSLSEGQQMKLVVWDIAGEDKFSSTAERYLRGANGLFIVADGTREATINTADDLLKQAQTIVGNIPAVRLVNKSDLPLAWNNGHDNPEDNRAQEIDGRILTSAKTGFNVQYAFESLANKVIA